MHQDWLSGNVHMVWGTQTLNLLKEWVRVGESTVVMVVVQEKTFLVDSFLNWIGGSALKH